MLYEPLTLLALITSAHVASAPPPPPAPAAQPAPTAQPAPPSTSPAGAPVSPAPAATTPAPAAGPTTASATVAPAPAVNPAPPPAVVGPAPQPAVVGQPPEQALVEVEEEVAPPAGPEFNMGVHAFVRGQGRINPDFGSGDAQDAVSVLERVRLAGSAKLGPVSAFAQVQDARTWGFEPGTAANTANTDLHQGYMQLAGATSSDSLSGSIRGGRQEVNYGRQRLIGGLGWAPNARSFDALRLHGQAGKFGADVLAAVLAPMGTVSDLADPPATDTSSGSQLYGVQLAGNIHDAFNAEVLGLFLVEDGRNNDIGWERRVNNFGAHLFGAPVKGLSYDAEFNFQVGDNNGRSHQAWAGAATVGYLYKGATVHPGGHVGYAIASGEACEGDAAAGCGAEDSTEFFNFFPTNHMHYGLVDLLGWRNMRDLEVGAKVVFPKKVKIAVTYHNFQLQEPSGRWSNAGGANVGAGWDPANTDHGLGNEIDLVVHLTPWEHFSLQPGYGVFIPSGAGKTLGGDSAQQFAYLWAITNF